MTTIQKYLTRIGADERTDPDLEYLAHLQERQLWHVPFENFSVLRGDPIELDEALLVDKIVQQKRGGFCYELNGAFGWLLRELGFDVKLISARGYDGGTQQFGPEFDHMALQVLLDGWYLVDVGFGDSARNPIALPEGESSDVSGCYRVRPLQENSGDKDLLRLENGEWQPQFRFTDTEYDLTAYAGMCHYYSTASDSHFNQGILCTRATEVGRLTLTEDALTITEHGEKKKIPFQNTAERLGSLRSNFGIDSAGKPQ